jgi:molybdopterin-guanine dinucleotide biosynthesis protein A
VTGIVLAGGRSSRFGGDKLATSYRGIPLLHHAVLRLGEICGEVLVVVGPTTVPPPLPPGSNSRLVRDPREGEGPLAGLLTGLQAATTELSLVAGGDMPDLSSAVLLEMLRVAGRAGVDAVVLQEDDVFRPFPVVLRDPPALTVAHDRFRAGERSIRGLLRTLRIAIVDEPTWTSLDPDRRTLFDVDEPGDLASG